jgi:hypothetical protein
MFGLGVLLYLVDAAKNREVTSISSVSGGSITNAFVAQMHGYHRRTSPDFWPAVAPLAKTVNGAPIKPPKPMQRAIPRVRNAPTLC